jgi:hypothetical protein
MEFYILETWIVVTPWEVENKVLPDMVREAALPRAP